jgi:hypothetical protein
MELMMAGAKENNATRNIPVVLLTKRGEGQFVRQA